MPLENLSSKLVKSILSLSAVTSCCGRSSGFFSSFFFFVLFIQVPAIAESYEETVLESATAGDPQSQFALALLYEYGSETMERNPAEAFFWLEKAGSEAVAGACLYLGMKYEYGNRVKKDLSKAACWYTCAARKGWPAAQFFLAGFYEHGKGVVPSSLNALAWFGLAAEYKYPGAEEAFLRLVKETGYDDMETLTKKQELLLQEKGADCN